MKMRCKQPIPVSGLDVADLSKTEALKRLLEQAALEQGILRKKKDKRVVKEKEQDE